MSKFLVDSSDELSLFEMFEQLTDTPVRSTTGPRNTSMKEYSSHTRCHSALDAFVSYHHAFATQGQKRPRNFNVHSIEIASRNSSSKRAVRAVIRKKALLHYSRPSWRGFSWDRMHEKSGFLKNRSPLRPSIREIIVQQRYGRMLTIIL